MSTSAGVADYRGPAGAWTMKRIRQLEGQKKLSSLSQSETSELERLLKEKKKKDKDEGEEEKEQVQGPKVKQKKVGMMDAQPTNTHMAMSTLIRTGLAK